MKPKPAPSRTRPSSSTTGRTASPGTPTESRICFVTNGAARAAAVVPRPSKNPSANRARNGLTKNHRVRMFAHRGIGVESGSAAEGPGVAAGAEGFCAVIMASAP